MVMNMKLAEALVLRADLQKRIEQFRNRLAQNALVQEGESPSENPQNLLTQLDQLLPQLENLIVRINKTNLQTSLSDQQSLTEALAHRDTLTMRYSILNNLVVTASNRVDRYGHSEIRILTTVNVSDLRNQLDEIARARRELDTAIQSKNWLTDLID